ncbi:MAG: DUF362 domain-containing protein [Patescibacteria group bacterium]|jgi:uncharacterized protein (DUF362 family)|nr:DUF362 domain-containing protein [Patescibacteria group bacterium]
MVIIKKSSKDILEISKRIEESFMEVSFKPGRTVFIKPNLSGRQPITEGENTTTYFLDALILVLNKMNCEKIIIGHSSLLGTKDRSYPFEKIINDSGFSKYYKNKKIDLLNLDKAKKGKAEIGKFIFETPAKLKEVDSYINLAKLKTHMETTISFSMKNQMGLLSETNRVNMHRNNLEELIAKLGSIVTPTINIVEGIVGMEGNGPHHGVDKEVDLFFVGKNMVEVDSVISYLIDLNPNEVTHLAEAQALGVGKIPNIDGLKKYDKFKFEFNKAVKFKKIGNKIFVWPTTSCSRCITALNEAGKEFRRPNKIFKLFISGFFGKEKHIIIGKGLPLKMPDNSKIICIGSCSGDLARKKSADCLKKCPPTVSEVKEYLTKQL